MSEEIDKHHCPVCVEASKQEKPKCNHRTPLLEGYGFGRVSGWVGIGVTYRCPDCMETLWFEEDGESCYPEELQANRKKKEENKHWEQFKNTAVFE